MRRLLPIGVAAGRKAVRPPHGWGMTPRIIDLVCRAFEAFKLQGDLQVVAPHPGVDACLLGTAPDRGVGGRLRGPDDMANAIVMHVR